MHLSDYMHTASWVAHGAPEDFELLGQKQGEDKFWRGGIDGRWKRLLLRGERDCYYKVKKAIFEKF